MVLKPNTRWRSTTRSRPCGNDAQPQYRGRSEWRILIKIAALDPFTGYKTAIDDKLDDAVAALDAFQVVKLGTAAVDEARRRVQQDALGHRGRKGDPLYGVQTNLRAGAENLTRSSARD